MIYVVGVDGDVVDLVPEGMEEEDGEDEEDESSDPDSDCEVGLSRVFSFTVTFGTDMQGRQKVAKVNLFFKNEFLILLFVCEKLVFLQLFCNLAFL